MHKGMYVSMCRVSLRESLVSKDLQLEYLCIGCLPVHVLDLEQTNSFVSNNALPGYGIWPTHPNNPPTFQARVFQQVRLRYVIP